MGPHYDKQGTYATSFKTHDKTILQVEEEVVDLYG